MAGLVFKVLFSTTVFAFCGGASDISKYLKVCNRNSVDLNDCMIEAVQTGILAMANGIPEMDIPGVDPYLQKELKLEYKNNQITVKMNLRDIQVNGLKDATVHDARVRADDDRLYIEIDLSAPKVWIKGVYEGEGQYNALKINAKGGFSSTLTDLVWTWKIDGTPEKNGTDTFVRVKSFYMRPDVGRMVSNLSNENPDSKELIELGNRFVNQNWRVLYRELLPYAQANWNRSGIRVANKIFLKVPYDQIFPNN